MFRYTLGTQKQNKTSVFQNTLTSTITKPLVLRTVAPTWAHLCDADYIVDIHAPCSIKRARLSFNLQCSTYWRYRMYHRTYFCDWAAPHQVLCSTYILHAFWRLQGQSSDVVLQSTHNSHTTILLPNYTHVLAYGALNGARK